MIRAATRPSTRPRANFAGRGPPGDRQFSLRHPPSNTMGAKTTSNSSIPRRHSTASITVAPTTPDCICSQRVDWSATRTTAPAHWPDYPPIPPPRRSWRRPTSRTTSYLFPGSPSRAAPISSTFPTPVPTERYPPCQRLPGWALGHVEHPPPPIPEEHRRQRLSARLRVHVLFRHEPQRRDAARDRQRFGATNYDYEVDATPAARK